MSEQLTPMVMGRIKVLLSQKNLSTKPVNMVDKGGCREHGDEVLRNGKTSVLKRLVQLDAKNTFNCVIVEIDGKQYVGDFEQFLEIQDLLAPIRLHTLEMERRFNSMDK